MRTAILTAVATSWLIAQPFVTKIVPSHEPIRDPNLAATIRQLIAAADNHDAGTLLRSMHSEIEWHDHAGIGIQYAREGLTETQEYWRPLSRVLQLEGDFTTKRGSGLAPVEYCMPYAYARYPTYEESPTGGPPALVILGNHVPLRAAYRPNARVLAFLSYDLVASRGMELVDGASENAWYEVEVDLPRRKTLAGWVPAAGVWDPDEDYRACFGEFDGKWLMTMFANERF